MKVKEPLLMSIFETYQINYVLYFLTHSHKIARNLGIVFLLNFTTINLTIRSKIAIQNITTRQIKNYPEVSGQVVAMC